LARFGGNFISARFWTPHANFMPARAPARASPAPPAASCARGAPSPPASPVKSCLACGKTGVDLLRCGRRKSAWFCGSACQTVAVKKQGHKSVNCRPTEEEVQPPLPSKPCTPLAIRTQPSTPDVAMLVCFLLTAVSNPMERCREAERRIGTNPAAAVTPRGGQSPGAKLPKPPRSKPKPVMKPRACLR